MATQTANTFSLLFDWERKFYRCIKNTPPPTASRSINVPLQMNIADILACPEWKERFIKRGLAFFYFIKYWVDYVIAVVPVTSQIQWKYFPGYNRLLKGFFVEMKLRSITEYPDALLEAATKLLTNERILNPLIGIVFHKANIYDGSTVIKTISFTDKLLHHFQKSKRSIPVTFNYVTLFKGVKTILNSEFSFAISQLLLLLYNHFSLFHVDFRKNISMYLLGKIFFKLFLNWSSNVQNIFTHLMVYKIYEESLTPDSDSYQDQNR